MQKKTWSYLILLFSFCFSSVKAESTTLGKARLGQALVVHGLNFKPDKMQSLQDLLSENGYEPTLLKLSGHDTDSPELSLNEMKYVTSDLWRTQVNNVYKRLMQQKKSPDEPILLLGYSLGGLVALDLVLRPIDIKVRFAKHILFAPALFTPFYVELVKICYLFNDDFIVPSFTKSDYQAHKNGTSVASYKALFNLKRSFSEHPSTAYSVLNVPTLMFIDPKDELVSASKLEDFIQEQKLTEWKTIHLDKNGTELPSSMHHLIIDRPALGTEQWQNKLVPAFQLFLQTQK